MGGKIIKSEEALAILRSSNLTALVEYPGSRVPWKAKCNLCEQIVSPRLHNLRNGHKGCIYCSERKMDPSRAIDKMLAAGLQPLEEYLSSKKPWKCRCLTCGEIVFPQYAMIRRGQGGCKFCANIKRGNSNKLTSEFAVSLMLTSNLQPLSEYVSSDKKWKCRCLICGLIVYPTLHSIRNGQGGCKNCGRKKAVIKID